MDERTGTSWRPRRQRGRLVRVRAADPVTHIKFNTHPWQIIGIAVYVRGRGLSWLWPVKLYSERRLVEWKRKDALERIEWWANSGTPTDGNP